MGFLKRLFGGEPAPPSSPSDAPITDWDAKALERRGARAYVFKRSPNTEVKGESHYKEALERLSGGRTDRGVKRPDHQAILLLEPNNPKDPNAVMVWVGGVGTVGYLSREDAIAYRPVIDRLASEGWLVGCQATLTGGWDRGRGDRGSIGVRLGLPTPGAAMKELDKAER